MSSSSKNFVIRIFFILMGMIVIMWAIKDYMMFQSSQNWPQTTAEIIHSQVKKSKVHRDIDYYADILYIFMVDGNTYRSNKISSNQDTFSISRSAVQKLVDNYPTGSFHEVYYNPDNPKDCFLIIGSRSFSNILLLIGIVLMLWGLFFSHVQRFIDAFRSDSLS